METNPDKFTVFIDIRVEDLSFRRMVFNRDSLEKLKICHKSNEGSLIQNFYSGQELTIDNRVFKVIAVEFEIKMEPKGYVSPPDDLPRLYNSTLMVYVKEVKEYVFTDEELDSMPF